MSAMLVLLTGWVTTDPATAHDTAGGNYQWGDYCYGDYWSDVRYGDVEAGMDDHFVSSSLGLCVASQVQVRERQDDGTWITHQDSDYLMPLAAEVARAVDYVSWTRHRSYYPELGWGTVTVYHNHNS